MELDIYKSLDFNIDLSALIDMSFLIVLFIFTVWLFFLVSGKSTNKAIEYLGTGTVVVGLAHLSEIIVHYSLVNDVYTAIFFHRFLATFGFVAIVMGFNLLIKNNY